MSTATNLVPFGERLLNVFRKRRPMTAPPPKKTSSGEHPEVKAMRAKFRSISEHEGQELSSLSKRTKEAAARLASERPDPRRDDDDPIPVDVVSFPDEPVTKPVRIKK